jgi:hypothetical protein
MLNRVKFKNLNFHLSIKIILNLQNFTVHSPHRLVAPSSSETLKQKYQCHSSPITNSPHRPVAFCNSETMEPLNHGTRPLVFSAHFLSAQRPLNSETLKRRSLGARLLYYSQINQDSSGKYFINIFTSSRFITLNPKF